MIEIDRDETDVDGVFQFFLPASFLARHMSSSQLHCSTVACLLPSSFLSSFSEDQRSDEEMRDRQRQMSHAMQVQVFFSPFPGHAGSAQSCHVCLFKMSQSRLLKFQFLCMSMFPVPVSVPS